MEIRKSEPGRSEWNIRNRDPEETGKMPEIGIRMKNQRVPAGAQLSAMLGFSRSCSISSGSLLFHTPFR